MLETHPGVCHCKTKESVSKEWWLSFGSETLDGRAPVLVCLAKFHVCVSLLLSCRCERHAGHSCIHLRLGTSGWHLHCVIIVGVFQGVVVYLRCLTAQGFLLFVVVYNTSGWFLIVVSFCSAITLVVDASCVFAQLQCS